MARPVAADAEATKARILHSALKLVAEHGIEGTSIRDVAAGARVSLATVLHYYESKDGLYEACINAMYVELEQLRDVLFASVGPKLVHGPAAVKLDEVLGDIVTAAVRFVLTHKAAHRILLRNILDEGGMRPDLREEYLRPFMADIAGLLAPLTGLPEMHVRMTAQSIVHLTVRYALHNHAELTILTGETDADKAQAAVEKHITDVARALLVRPT